MSNVPNNTGHNITLGNSFYGLLELLVLSILNSAVPALAEAPGCAYHCPTGP